MTTPMFDDLVEINQPEAPVTDEPTAESNGQWPKTVDAAPQGVKTVQEFADHIKALLVERLVSEGKSLYEAIAENSRVNTNSVYQYARRDKNPMPSVLVRTTNEDDGTPGDPKIFIPTDEATEWWMNRPERGSAGLAELDVEKLLFKAGKKAAFVEKLLARQENLATVLERQTRLRDRYGERLEASGKTWDEANAAYQEQVEKDADKDSKENEISDTE